MAHIRIKTFSLLQLQKSQLIRRLAFDVAGLPPSPELVVAFEADDPTDAYESLVDEFLQSEEFGVRWHGCGSILSLTPWIPAG